MVVHITESHEQGISAPTTMIVTMVHYHSHSMERVNSRLSLSADCYSFDRPGFWVLAELYGAGVTWCRNNDQRGCYISLCHRSRDSCCKIVARICISIPSLVVSRVWSGGVAAPCFKLISQISHIALTTRRDDKTTRR